MSSGNYLPTRPGTQITWTVEKRDQPCRICRLPVWLRLLITGRRSQHWNCAPPLIIPADVPAGPAPSPAVKLTALAMTDHLAGYHESNPHDSCPWCCE